MKTEKEIVVSVCMICYNQELYVSDAIEGILIQETTFPIELIIGDDFSTDKTRQICSKYQERFPDIIKLRLPNRNTGINCNFLDTFQIAKGKYIAFCEGDDYWNDKKKLQKQVDFLEKNPEYGLIYTDFLVFNQNEKRFCESNIKGTKINCFEDHLKYAEYLAPMTWLFKKEFNPNRFNYKNTLSDISYAFMLDVLQNTKIFYLDEVAAVYRITSGSASRQLTNFKRFKYELGIFRIQQEYIEKYNVKDQKIIDYIYSDNYFRLLPLAMTCKNESFTQEAKSYFSNKNLAFDAFENLASHRNKLEREMISIQNSKPYQLGKYILKPFKDIWRITNKTR